MKCPFCGDEINSGVVYCPTCGNNLAELRNRQQQNYRSNAANSQRADFGNNAYNGNYNDFGDGRMNGYNNGYDNSYDNGYNDGYDNGYDNGEEYEDDDNGENKKNKALLGVAIGLGCVVIVLLAVLIAFVVGDKKGGGDAKTDITTSNTSVSDMPSSSVPDASNPSVAGSSGVVTTAPVSSGIVTPTSGAVGSIAPGKYMVNTQQDDLNVRSGAGSDYSIVGRIPKGTVVDVTVVNGTWGYISYNGTSGWVATQYLLPVTA